jgi:DNA-binding transcriptional ArsR family regulator
VSGTMGETPPPQQTAMPVTQQRRGDAKATFPGWEPFLPQLVHPIKVALVEALIYIGEPLSTVQLARMLGSIDEGFRESNVRYHLNHLAEVGVLEDDPNRDGQVGDARQKFFYFARSWA